MKKLKYILSYILLIIPFCLGFASGYLFRGLHAGYMMGYLSLQKSLAADFEKAVAERMKQRKLEQLSMTSTEQDDDAEFIDDEE